MKKPLILLLSAIMIFLVHCKRSPTEGSTQTSTYELKFETSPKSGVPIIIASEQQASIIDKSSTEKNHLIVSIKGRPKFLLPKQLRHITTNGNAHDKEMPCETSFSVGKEKEIYLSSMENVPCEEFKNNMIQSHKNLTVIVLIDEKYIDKSDPYKINFIFDPTNKTYIAEGELLDSYY